MPGPAGTQQAYNIQHLPQHVKLQRGQRGPVIEQPKQYQFGKSTVTGASAGAASGGWIGAAIGAGVGLAGDVVGYFTNKKQQERANEFNKQQAADAFAREQMAQREAAHWNSEQAQVERLKKAGLSPALAYGQMSPSTMQAANSSAASAAPMPNQDFSGAASGAEAGANAAISAQQAESLIELQSAQGAKTELERIQLEIDNITRHRQNIAGIEQQLAAANLDKATKSRLELLMQEEKNQLLASIDNLKASSANFGAQAKFISGAQTSQALADANLKAAQTTTEKERPALVKAQVETEWSSSNLNVHLARESEERKNQVYLANKEYSSHWDAIEGLLEDYGINKAYTPIAVKFLSALYPEIAAKGSQAVESWIDGGTWIDFFARWISSKNIGRANAFGHILGDEKKN